jgi:hypothetical protein
MYLYLHLEFKYAVFIYFQNGNLCKKNLNTALNPPLSLIETLAWMSDSCLMPSEQFFSYVNILSWIFIVLAPWEDISPHSETLSWLLVNQSLLLLLNTVWEAANTNFIVFDLTKLGLKPTIYRIWGERTDHYTTDAVCYSPVSLVLLLQLKNLPCTMRGRRGHNRMVVGFTTTCAINAYHH